MRSALIVILCLYTLFSYGQDQLKYKPGISFTAESSHPNEMENEYQYFTNTFNSGYSLSLGISNKFYYKKLYICFNANLGYSKQYQKFTFSNEIDNIIENSVDYDIPIWSFDYSIGRDFNINEINTLSLELGFSTIGDFRNSPLGSEIFKEGSFTSEFVEADNHSNGVSSQEYEFSISYEWQTYLSPFLKCSISIPVTSNELRVGVVGRLNNIQYDSFINISGGNYSAIATSSLVAGSVGLCFNYLFQ